MGFYNELLRYKTDINFLWRIVDKLAVRKTGQGRDTLPCWET